VRRCQDDLAGEPGAGVAGAQGISWTLSASSRETRSSGHGDDVQERAMAVPASAFLHLCETGRARPGCGATGRAAVRSR